MSIDKIELNNIIFNELKNNKTLLVSSFLLISALMLAQVVFPRSYSEFITNFPDDVSKLTYASVLIVLAPYFISELLFYWGDKIDSHVFPNIEMHVINDLFKKIMLSTKTTKKEINPNELILNFKKIFDLRDIYHLTTSYIMPALITTLALGYYFIIADKKYGICVMVILAIALYCMIKLSIDCFNLTEDNEKHTNVFFDDTHDVITNIDHVITAGMDKQEEKRTFDRQNILKNSFILKDMGNTNLKFIFSIAYFFIMVALDGVAIYLYHKKKIDKVTLISIIFMVLSLVSMYDGLIYELHNITRVIGNLNELNSYFNQFEYTNSSNLIKNMNVTNGKIEFKNIKLNYGNKQIFNNLNLTIEPNSHVGIVGEIGSGKSTLLKLLVGLIKFDGSILIDNMDVSNYDFLALAKNIAYIPQTPKLFNRTVFDNLNYGSNYSENQIKNILKKLDVLDIFMGLKDGLQTSVGKNGEKLSGGQRQLLYILRSFIQNKKILLFDEPTSSLDVQSKKHLINLLKKLNDKTILMITHDKDMLVIFDRIITFDSGMIIANTTNIETYEGYKLLE